MTQNYFNPPRPKLLNDLGCPQNQLARDKRHQGNCVIIPNKILCTPFFLGLEQGFFKLGTDEQQVQ